MRSFGLSLALLFAMQAPPAKQPVLLLQRNYFSTGTFYTDCVQVQEDGSYRFEHRYAALYEHESHQIHAGKLTDDELRQLRAVLDEPGLQALRTPGLQSAGMTVGSDIDTYWVAIARSSTPQVLFFNSTTSSGKKYASQQLPSAYSTPAMKPLLNWYKQMGKRKGDIDKTAQPSCKFQVLEHQSGH